MRNSTYIYMYPNGRFFNFLFVAISILIILSFLYSRYQVPREMVGEITINKNCFSLNDRILIQIKLLPPVENEGVVYPLLRFAIHAITTDSVVLENLAFDDSEITTYHEGESLRGSVAANYKYGDKLIRYSAENYDGVFVIDHIGENSFCMKHKNLVLHRMSDREFVSD